MSPGASSHSPESQRAEDALARLDAEISRRLPQWRSRGPEDPARILLESFARTIARMEGEVAGVVDRLLPRLLAALGETPLWPRAARTAIRLIAREGFEETTRVPAGTGVTASRAAASGADGTRVFFETTRDAWVSGARLRRSVVLEGEEVRELPLEPTADPLAVFRSTRLRRHLYLGDAAWDVIRFSRDGLVLEWPDAPPSVVEGDWEYSVGNGWQSLPVDFAESTDSTGERVVRMRVHGPLPDLRERVVEGIDLTWFRLAIREAARVTLPVPSIAWLPPAFDSSDEAADSRSASRVSSAARRPIARMLLESGGTWEDHSLSSGSRVASRPIPIDWQPTVYFGWDRASAGSVYFRGANALLSGVRADVGGSGAGGGAGRPRWTWEFSTAREFRSFEVLDDSHGFARSGTIAWGLPDAWERVERFGDELFWMRARWVGGEYERTPLVEALIPNAVEVVEGRGVRDLPVSLEFDPRSRTAALPPHPEGAIEPFDRLQIRTDSVADSGDTESGWRSLTRTASDETLDESSFRLELDADGAVRVEIHRSVAGTLDARIPEARVGIGLAGQLDAGLLDILEADVDGLDRIAQPVAASGGRGRESREEFLRRVDSERRVNARVVTEEDYRIAARAFDPSLGRVEVMAAPGGATEVWVIVLGVESCSFGADLREESSGDPVSPRRLEALGAYLRERAPLGTRVQAVEPRRIPVRVSVHLEAEEASGESMTRDQAAEFERFERALREHLHPLTGGAGNGVALVRGIAASSLREFIDAFSWSPAAGEPSAVEIDPNLDRVAPFDLPIGLPVLESVVPVLRRRRAKVDGPSAADRAESES